MRHQYLVRAHPCHLNPTGSAWVHTENVTTTGGGQVGATFVVEAEVDNDSPQPCQGALVRAVVRDAVTGAVVATSASSSRSRGFGGGGDGQDIPAGATRFELAPLSLPVPSGIQSWSVQLPYLYNVEVSLELAGVGVVDAVNVTTGVRTLRFDADHGLFVNDQRVKLRGFCDHSSFAGVGAALGDRINLFRAQVGRCVSCCVCARSIT
jgi:beta-galactosidase